MKILLTLDYELFFGKKSGSPDKAIIEGTNKLLEICDPYNIKINFFVDVLYLITLKKFSLKYKNLENDLHKVEENLIQLSKNGHDIHLHLHPHWINSVYNGKEWIFDYKNYRLNQFSQNEIDNIVDESYNYLYSLIGSVGNAYRAGGWSIQPFSDVKNIFKKYNILIDSTVIPNAEYYSEAQRYNFIGAPTNQTAWRFSENPAVPDPSGDFLEIPISWYKVSPIFYWKYALIKKFKLKTHMPIGDGYSIANSNKRNLNLLTRYSKSTVSIDGYKASYLMNAFEKYVKSYQNKSTTNYFVIIGHPKSLTEYSLKLVNDFVKKYNLHHQFIKYSDVKF